MQGTFVLTIMAIVGGCCSQSTQKYQCSLKDNVDCLRDELAICRLEYDSLKQQLNVCSQPKPSSGTQLLETWISGGYQINDTYASVIRKVKLRDQKQEMYEFSKWAPRMSVVGGQLWVPFYHNQTIQIVDPEVPHYTGMISLPQQIYDIRQTHSNVVLLSSNSGLHVLDVQGVYLYIITSGAFSGLFTMGDVAYVYQMSGYIVTLEYSNDRWGVNNTFPVAVIGHGDVTISRVLNILYMCLWNGHTIYTYTLTGRYITKYGSYGSNSPGQLSRPRLCGIDSQNSQLVCDEGNNRFQVLSPDGTWQVLELEVTKPGDVVIDVSGNVWVLSGWIGLNGPNKITRF